MEEQGFQLSSVVGFIRRRLRLFLYAAGSVFLVAVVVAAVLPNQFQVYTTLLIEPQTISRHLVEAGLEKSDLNSRLHLMTMQILSRARLSRLIDDLDLYPEESKEMTREEVIEYMRSQIWVEPVLPALETEMLRNQSREIEINTFRLFYRHENAGIAATVANRLANDFIDEHIKDRVQVSGDTAEFIEGELTRLSQRIREVEGAIAQVKDENPGRLPEDRAANELEATRGIDALRETQRRLAEAESDEVFYGQQATVARAVEGGRGDVVGKAVSPTLRLQELEMVLGELRAKGFTDKHPDVVTAMAEMEQLHGRVDASRADPDGAPASVAEQEARAEAQRAGLRAQSERAEVERLRTDIDAARERLAATPRVEEQIEALTREYLSLGENVREYSNKRLEAGVAANMERRQKGEQFRVLEPAFPPADPVSPDRLLILFLGALLGIAAGGGLGVVLEATDSSYHEPRRLQESLRIPVLAAIPSIVFDVDRRALRRLRMREAMAAVVVSGVVLFGAGVGYVFVNRPGLFGAAVQATQPAPAEPGAAAPVEPPAGAAAEPAGAVEQPSGAAAPAAGEPG
jgi:polysaccharide chain length determinant protein (PEP-CTERM system associated)